MSKEEPVCTEVTVSSSVGGKVQIVKYEYSADFHYSFTQKWSVPPGWSSQDVKDFEQDKAIEIRTQLEGIAQAEMDDLLEQKKELS